MLNGILFIIIVACSVIIALTLITRNLISKEEQAIESNDSEKKHIDLGAKITLSDSPKCKCTLFDCPSKYYVEVINGKNKTLVVRLCFKNKNIFLSSENYKNKTHAKKKAQELSACLNCELVTNKKEIV